MRCTGCGRDRRDVRTIGYTEVRESIAVIGHADRSSGIHRRAWVARSALTVLVLDKWRQAQPRPVICDS